MQHLILMDPCIVDYSVEIPTTCSYVIEFIIPKLFEGSTCFEQPVTIWAYKPEAANTV